MFGWMRSPSSNRIRMDEPENRSLFSSKRKERSTDSFSSLSDPEASMNIDFEDSFFVSKESAISNRSKQLSRNIISMFKKKSKNVTSTDTVKNRSTSGLLDESVNEMMDPEQEGNFPNQPGTKKSKRRRRGTLQSVLSVEHKNKLFKRKPLDDYAKRKLQISRDSGWEASSSSSSLSSLVNEVAVFSTSSPIVKTDSKKKQLRIPKKLKNTSGILRRRTMLFARAISAGSSTETCKSEEETSRLVDDKLSTSFGSSSSVNKSEFNSYKSAGNQIRSIADILYKFEGLNFARSLDCLACGSMNVKICDKCTVSYDASKSQGENRASGFSGTTSSGRIKLFDELKLAKRSNSTRDIKSLRKHGKRFVTSASSSTASSPEKVNQARDLEDACSNGHLESDRWENFSSGAGSWRSKSPEELFEDDLLFSSSDVAEFNSFNDLPTTNSPHSSQDDSDGCFFNEALDTSDEVNPAEHTDIQQLSLHFDCENEADGSRCFDSFNSPYVITMYV